MAVLAGGWAGFWTRSPWVGAAWWALLVVGVGLAVVDLREHRLPTWLIVAAGALVAVALTVAAGVAGDWERWWAAAGCATAAFAVFYLLAMVSGMGYGDVKLAAVIAGCAGYSSPAAAAGALMAGMLVAGVVGGMWAASRGRTSAMPVGPWLLLGAAASLAAGAGGG